MCSKQMSLLVAGIILAVSASVQAVDAQENTTDKTKYRSLLREIKTVEAEYTVVQSQAVKEVKRDGSAALETKSRLQGLEDKRNRIMDRLLLLSLRYGWDIPDRNMPTDQSVNEPTDERDRIFAPADEIIKKMFVKEAREIAGKIQLPLISIGGFKKNKKLVVEGGEFE